MLAIRAERLTKSYPGGVVGLDGLAVRVEEGEFVGILGPSGAGKTTFFRLINGAIHPTSGRLEVLGQLMGSLRGDSLCRLRARVAFIYQHHHLIPNLTVAHNVLMGRAGRASLWQTLRSIFYLRECDLRLAEAALREVGIVDKMFDRVADLSGGQQQRVAIARALVQSADLILADEPIASVDSTTATVILELFKRLNEEQGKTILMTLHQTDFALRYCRRLLIFAQGGLAFDGPPDGVVAAQSFPRREVHHAP